MFSAKSSRKVGIVIMNLGLVGMALLLITASIWAQVAGSTLSGTVTDASGATVAQAQISIRNLATGVTTPVSSNAGGFYSVPNLLPGNYEVKVSASGFSTEVRNGITLTVGAQQVLNFALQVGQVSQTVVVTEQAPNIDLGSATISATVNSTTVVEMPLNGRSWTDLTSLQPGVNVIPTQPTFQGGVDRGNRGFGIQLTISGGRPVQNNYRLNGISMNDYANAGPGSVVGGNLGVDAIQEFSVLTTNYSAEYGKTSGGVINAISRSGTNGFHGNAYEFLRNSALDARNPLDAAGSVPPFKRNQFGASVGGPILKDRAFFFVDYEGIRQSKGVTLSGETMTQAAQGGNLCSVPDGSATCSPPLQVTVDPAAQKYLTFFPLPNGALVQGTGGSLGFFSFPANQILGENFLTTRLDFKISDKDSVFGSYMFDRALFTGPDSLNQVLKGNKTARQFVTLEEDHAFSNNLVNTVRIGFNRDAANASYDNAPINPNTAAAGFTDVPGANAAGITFGGAVTPFPGGFTKGPGSYYPWNSYQVYDDAFLTRGTHSIKFGFAVERMQLNEKINAGGSGAWTFGGFLNGIQGFLTNNPKRLTFVSGAASRDLRQTIFGGYIQDDWRLRPNLTLNLGLRYEMATDETERYGKLGVVKGWFTNSAVQVPQAYNVGGPLFHNPTHRNFEPRVGFAWDPFKKGKTSVRGGFGMFDVLPLIYQNFNPQILAAPLTQRSIVGSPGTGSFPNTAATLANVGASSRFTGWYAEQNPHRSYVMQWNFNVQQQITPTLTAMVGYVGSRGTHLPFFLDDANIAIPTLTSAGYLWPNPVGSGIPVNNMGLGSTHAIFFQANSFYDAMQIAVSKSLGHGLQFQDTFTWGKSIDTSSASGLGDQFGNSISSMDWFDQSLTRARSDFNVGRTVNVSITWKLPTAKSLPGAAAFFTNGWELGTIFTASDGVPFTITWGTGSDPAGTLSGDDYAFPDRLNGPGCATLTNPGDSINYIKTQCFSVPTAPSVAYFNAAQPLGCDPAFGSTNPAAPNYLWCFNKRGTAGRNIITGPGLVNLNFSVNKDNYIRRISETFDVQFRAEIFNILNHPNWQPPHTANAEADVFDSTGTPNLAVGTLTRTATDSREIQFALKFIF
jgi:outer membrane receptor protein involved in Fe transport